MKKVRKFGAIVGLMAVMMSALAGCANKTTCEMCETKQKCKQKEYFGEKVWICKDCESIMDAFMNGDVQF